MRPQLAEGPQAISGSLSFNMYAVLGELLDDKGSCIMPCLSIILKTWVLILQCI